LARIDEGCGMTEREDILETLAAHRRFLLFTVRGLSDDQARLTPTASALSLGGLLKHVTLTEQQWVEFLLTGPDAMAMTEERMAAHADSFVLRDDETLQDVVTRYEETAGKTDDLLRGLPDLDASQPLPEAPWFPKGARRSARRVFLHIIAETSQHAGHADIIRESIDGQRTMG
jgi:uncharacterized damage-inducible protein DinB